jgi:hypothetical protein
VNFSEPFRSRTAPGALSLGEGISIGTLEVAVPTPIP